MACSGSLWEKQFFEFRSESTIGQYLVCLLPGVIISMCPIFLSNWKGALIYLQGKAESSQHDPQIFHSLIIDSPNFTLPLVMACKKGNQGAVLAVTSLLCPLTKWGAQ